MCVRTVASSQKLPPPDDNPPPLTQNRQPAGNAATTAAAAVAAAATVTTTKNGLTRAKEKYMKLHDEMLKRDAAVKARPREEAKSNGNTAGEVTEEEQSQPEDFLAWSTIVFKQLLRKLQHRLNQCQDSKLYKVLFYTAQPAHVIMIAAVLCVTSALLPTGSERTPNQTTGQPRSRLTSFVYLASFVMHFGSQIWMTFVSGLSLYFALPRHAFGEVQRILFPRYFSFNACLSLTTLLIYVKHHSAHSWDSEITIQVISMGGAFFLELLIRLYLTPPLMKLIEMKTNLERAAGIGTEIGRHDPGPLKHCPHYLKIHRAFRKTHMTIAMGNMLTMACTVLQLNYIASKLCVL